MIETEETLGQVSAHSVNEFIATVSRRGVRMHLPSYPLFGEALVDIASIQLVREGVDFTHVQPPKHLKSGAPLIAAMAVKYLRSEGYRIGPFSRRKITEMARVVTE